MKKFLVASVVTLALFSVTVQPAFAAENIFQKVTNSIQSRFERIYLMLPGEKSGQAVLKESVNAMQGLKTTQVDASITADLQEEGKSQANAKLSIGGPVKIDNAYDPKSYQQDLKVNGEVSMQGTTLKGDADFKVDGAMLYFKLNEIPALPYFNLADLKGKWLKTENKSAEKDTKMDADKQEKAKAAFMKLMKDSEIGSAKKETRDGHKVFVINVTTPKAAVKEYLTSVKEATVEDSTTSEKSMAELDKGLDQLGDLKSTILVDSGSFYIRQYELPLTFKPEVKEPEEAMTSRSTNPFSSLGKIDQVNLVITVKMDKFNEPINFTVPTDAEEAQQAFQKSMMKSNPTLSNTMMLNSGSDDEMTDFEKKPKTMPSAMPKIDISKYKDQMSPADYAKLKELGY